MAFRFESLEVWHLAIKYASKVYKLAKKFPKEEVFGLTPQIRRAAVSIAFNITVLWQILLKSWIDGPP